MSSIPLRFREDSEICIAQSAGWSWYRVDDDDLDASRVMGRVFRSVTPQYAPNA